MDYLTLRNYHCLKVRLRYFLLSYQFNSNLWDNTTLNRKVVMIKTVEYVDGSVRMIDQTRLPSEKVFVDCKTIDDVANAIKTFKYGYFENRNSNRNTSKKVFS